MTKVIITGANSFIGRNFIKFSHNRDIEEVSLIDYEPEEIEFSKYDIVLHLAAIVHRSRKIPDEEYFRINCDLSLRIAEQAKKSGIKQFIFLSTLKVYSESMSGIDIRNELSICYPSDVYGQSKYEAEIRIKKIEDKDFKVSIIRPSLVYGEGVKANMLSLIKIVDMCPILPFGKITNKRNFVYIENLIGYIDRVIETRASGIYIAIDAKAISTTELVNYLSKYLEKKTVLVSLPRIILRLISFIFPDISNRLFGSLEFDNSITLNELNFTVPFTTEEGIRRTIIAYRHQKSIK
jgi:nucleoside-diphosphate-sugar epimerase